MSSSMHRSMRIERLSGNPIIQPGMLPGQDGDNINGPSLIRVPEWVANPLGNYYLYFGHHVGGYIRMAYADTLSGPWTVYEPGVLRLEDTECAAVDHLAWAHYRHIASPDVHIDDQNHTIRMYFHGPAYASGPPSEKDSYRQLSFVATSTDGLHFTARSERLGDSYLRVFAWDGAYYGMAMPGIFYRSADGLQRFTTGPRLFTDDMRHAALKIEGSTLLVFYSIVGENPERIVLSTIDLSVPWMQWAASEPIVVLEPEYDWEGASLPLLPSVRGLARTPVRQLRDPAIFQEDGKTYLLYAVAGESGIAIAQLHTA